ncbi:MAG: hypothetical protein M1368_07170, partial [Thaumarchaeota archaeon]|nr:hypothetical protein [Nitrososphaerota archaeon]
VWTTVGCPASVVVGASVVEGGSVVLGGVVVFVLPAELAEDPQAAKRRARTAAKLILFIVTSLGSLSGVYRPICGMQNRFG